MLTINEWHRRYLQQAEWTGGVRNYLFSKFPLHPGSRILEAGCGTGAVLQKIHEKNPGHLFGLDLKLDCLEYAANTFPSIGLACADAHSLPYAAGRFDLTFSHFFLLWVKNPLHTLIEMQRVTRRGGIVAALAEPDYGARIDYPAPLDELGRQQAQALKRQGADIHLGRKLAGLFNEAGFREVQVGLIGGEWGKPFELAAWEKEWTMLESDLAGVLSPEDLTHYRRVDAAAWKNGGRILFVPTFYAIGVVP